MNIIDLAGYKCSRGQHSWTLQEWLDWQEKLHFTAIELGLDRCRRVADAMQLLPPRFYVISIAGTNGKGSCAVMLDLILREAGYKTGLYSSPHLTRYNERIKINGHEMSDEALCQSFTKINQARGEISLTYFEFGTIAAIDIFAENHIDIAIMEVGMGGRLDAVNMLDANIGIISTIDIDHEQWLGDTREDIAREKSGIFRAMRPSVCGDINPPSTIRDMADLVGSNLFQVGIDFQYDISGNSWSWQSGTTRYPKLPVPGKLDYQVQNAATVLMALQTMSQHFPVSHEAILSGLSRFSMPGRFHMIKSNNLMVLDVAHNPQSALILKQNIRKYLDKQRIIMIVAMLKDKNHTKFIAELSACVDLLCLAGLGTDRGATCEDLEKAIQPGDIDTELVVFDKLHEAFSWSKTIAQPGDVVVITGSFITVGMAIDFFNIEY